MPKTELHLALPVDTGYTQTFDHDALEQALRAASDTNIPVCLDYDSSNVIGKMTGYSSAPLGESRGYTVFVEIDDTHADDIAIAGIGYQPLEGINSMSMTNGTPHITQLKIFCIGALTKHGGFNASH